MRRKEKNGVEWLEFELLSSVPEVVHGVFLRKGGEGSCASLNFGGNTGDREDNIRKNCRKVLEVLGIPHLASPYQVHSDRVVHVTGGNFPDREEADGLLTRVAGIGLMIKHADCQAAIFYDTRNKALANVHSGWRGNVKNIYARTVAQMKEEFGTSPKDLLVCISPSLGPSHSEFKHFREELPESFWGFQIRPTYFDLWAIARHQLEECGILSHHIEIASICTYSHPDDFFSYRRDKSHIGNNATVAALL